MRILLLALTLCSLDLMGQELLDQQHWSDGTLKSTRFLADGREHFITYHENGRISEVGAYRNGRCDGLWKRYAESGALILVARFSEGTRQGTWEFRTEENVPLGRLHFRNGALARSEQLGDLGQVVAQRLY
jgi:antitoxin component YwqK of YwqJK toxin-antitoxin module